MNVGIFSESYDPIINGVAASVSTLVEELRVLGHEVFVFAPSYPGYRQPVPNVYRFRAVHTWVDDYPIPIPIYPGLNRLARDLGLDVIHTQTPWLLGWVGMRLARGLRIPIVSTNHTRYPEYAHYVPLIPESLVRGGIIARMRRYYNQCDAVIVPSQPIDDVLRSYGVSTATHVIPSGVSLGGPKDPAIRAAIRARLGIGEGEIVVLYVGRLAREKNLQLLMDAFAGLAQRRPAVRLLVVGGGPFEPELRRMAAGMECPAKVCFAGYVPRTDVAAYYSAGDIFAFASTTETQGLVVGEALSAGLPCVAVSAIGSKDAVRHGENGFLTDESVDDLHAKLDLLVSDPELLRRFSLNASKNGAVFHGHDMARRILDVYESTRGALVCRP